MNRLQALLAHSGLHRLFNMGLRLSSLALKLVLTLYMGKYLGLSEMGTYGLVAAYVAIAIPLMGFRLDYVVSREIVGEDPHKLVSKMRDQAMCYLINYLILMAAVLIVTLTAFGGLDRSILFYTLCIAILESIAAVSGANMISLGRPIVSNFLFFIRSALWVIPVVVLGYFDPEYRTADFIFKMWVAGIALSLVGTWVAWRTLPWIDAIKTPINWSWIKAGIIRCFPLWLAAIASAISGYLDRFVVEFNLGRDYVGIISFYSSFIFAISAVVTSGVFAYGFPNLVRRYKDKDVAGFSKETRNMALHATVTAGALCLVLAFAIPWVGNHFGRPEFVQYAPVFWLMLFSIFLKTSTECYYYVLYAWNEDKAVWMSSFLFLGLSLMTTVALTPIFGLMGIGYSAVITAIFLCWLRWHNVRKVRHVHEANPVLS